MESVSIATGQGSFAFNPEINLLLTTSSPIVVYGEILEAGTASIEVNAGSATVTGSGFQTELKVGSIIYVTDTGESQVVTAIASDSLLTVGAAFSESTLSPSAYTHRTTREYYWDTFTNDSRKSVAGGAITPFEVTHGANTLQIAAGVATAPTPGSLDNFTTIPDELVIDTVNSLSVTMDNTPSTDAVEFYVLTENTDNTNVVSYRSAISESLVSGSMTLTIDAATHGLPNLHILPFLYAEKVAGQMSQVIPDSFTVDDNGDVIITVDNADGTIGGGTTFEGQIVLIDVPGSQALEASFTSGDGTTMEFTGITTDFNFYALYDQQPSGDQVLVIPDSIFYDSVNDKTVR
jgi:hypothetical protein